MRKLVLLLFYFLGAYLAKAQNQTSIHKDTTSNGLNLKAFQSKSIEVPNTFFYPTDKLFAKKRSMNDILYSMPIITPNVNDSMLNYPLDTSKNHSLLVFDIKNTL